LDLITLFTQISDNLFEYQASNNINILLSLFFSGKVSEVFMVT
jgi:hypothetical protein